MFWQGDTPAVTSIVTHDVVDLVFRVSGGQLPTDHAYAMCHAVTASLPWLEQEENAGIHHIHISESGNGWARPTENGLLQLSRRSRFVLRLREDRTGSARSLCGQHILIEGHRIEIGTANVRPLNPLPTVYARHVVIEGDVEDETAFLHWVKQHLQGLGLAPRKMLCGKTRLIQTPGERLATRSLMITDLKPQDSISLQQYGLGTGRKLGCGLFLPHRGIDAVYDADPS